MNSALIKIKKIPGAFISQLEIVEIKGRRFVLKTNTIDAIVNEKKFYGEMKKHNAPYLKIFPHRDLSKNQILFEYIEKSPHKIEDLTGKFCKQWGQTVRKMHNITYNQCFKISSRGKRIYNSWNTYINLEIKKALKKIDKIKIASSKKKRLAIKKYLYTYAGVPQLKAYNLLHYDLHPYNTVMKEKMVVLIDKNSALFSGDKSYDLAKLLINFPQGTYIHSKKFIHKNDRKLLKNFIDGYGINFINKNEELLNFYVLLRAIVWHPNRYKEVLDGIIAYTINKYKL